MKKIVIPGKPFAKERPRFSKGRTYTPERTRQFEDMVAQVTALTFREPLTGPVIVQIHAVFKTPKSWSRKKTEALLYTPHTQTPDLDNIAKAILDGMNGIAFEDDKQISETVLRKTWGDRDETIIFIAEHVADGVENGS